jgi:hypothetical protein
MIFNNHQDYLRAKAIWDNTSARCINGKVEVYVKNEWVSGEEYYANNTRPIFEVAIIPNPDGRHIATGIKPERAYRGRKYETTK